MPLPKLTDQIINASKQVEPGWSPLTLNSIREAKSKAGTSVNYFFEFVADAGPGNQTTNTGRSVTCMISGASLDGHFADACALYAELLAALADAPVKDVVNVELTNDALIGRKVWAEIQDVERDGKLMKEFRHFSPGSVVPF